MAFTTPSGVARGSLTSVRFSSKGWPDSYKTALHLREANPNTVYCSLVVCKDLCDLDHRRNSFNVESSSRPVLDVQQKLGVNLDTAEAEYLCAQPA
jgi:hypothetical protein